MHEDQPAIAIASAVRVRENQGMSRIPPWLLVIVIWAAIYLPALGLFEIKGEEGRRILPAVTMLETGNYVVPRVGGASYFNKPPLVNWLVAASFKVFGQRNEWTARLPSALCLLAVALAFVLIAHDSLGSRGSTIAALIWLTNIGMIEKGRLIEIEALYVSLCALAIICWLSCWIQERSPWLTWTVPWIFLGFGWLAKGPTLLVFFYAVVLAVLWQTKQWKAFFHPAHFVGLLIMFGIFASWAIPFLKMTFRERPMTKWSGQFVGRVTGGFFNPGVWILALPRTLAYFLPWLLFLPLVRLNKFRDERQRALVHALMWSSALPLIVFELIPGAAPRYSLPVLAPFCWLLAMSFAEDAFARPVWLNWRDQPLWSRVAVPLVGLAIAAGLIGYPLAATLIFKDRQKIKNVAAAINAVVPQTEILYAVDPHYQPFFFYMRAPVKYVWRLAALSKDTRYFLVRPEMESAAAASEQWLPRRARPVLRVTDYRHQTVVLFRVDSF
jgi:4-amino-4-deoxy-L-arabinose transferase-like glycosyltransferase